MGLHALLSESAKKSSHQPYGADFHTVPPSTPFTRTRGASYEGRHGWLDVVSHALLESLSTLWPEEPGTLHAKGPFFPCILVLPHLWEMGDPPTNSHPLAMHFMVALPRSATSLGLMCST